MKLNVFRFAALFTLLFIVIGNACARGQNDTVSGEEGIKNADGSYAHLKTSNTIGDILNHPAFSGFSRFILPWDNRNYDESMRLTNAGALLPYHSNVDPDTVVSTINHMIDEVNSGKTIFYDFYTEQHKRDDPAKETTGLFFFRREPGAPFAVICPGGGFSYVGSIHEGFPYALEINKKGYNAFVLKYRVGDWDQSSTEDLVAALSYIFDNAQTLEVSTQDYSVWGSSAGAIISANIGSKGTAAYGGNNLPKPCTVVMAYTRYTYFFTDAPPTFVTIGENDGIVMGGVAPVDQRIEDMKNAGIAVEYRKYRNLGHGFGLGVGTTAEGWIEHAIQFWGNHRRK
jgi:acetyl esterase/lipase